MEPIIFPCHAAEDPQALIAREEARYRAGVAKAAEIAVNKKARFIFLAGPSCSGKTTTSLELIADLEKKGLRCVTFSTDDFFFNGDLAPKNEDGTPNYDAFEHTDSDYILSVLNRLSKNETALLPVFDFTTGNRSDRVIPLSGADYDVFILEGIHALNDKILSGLSSDRARVCFYLDVTEGVMTEEGKAALSPIDIRFCRRLIRDFKHRNADAERTFSLWKNVLCSEKEILHPYRKNADFTINTNFSYEIAVEKEEVLSLLEKLDGDSVFYPAACSLKEKLSHFPSLDEKLVPNNSVLREFID